jgi:hypothetical protein
MSLVLAMPEKQADIGGLGHSSRTWNIVANLG